jgi:hypothetical protein
MDVESFSMDTAQFDTHPFAFRLSTFALIGPVAPHKDAVKHGVLTLVFVVAGLVHGRAVVDDQHVAQSVFVLVK